MILRTFYNKMQRISHKTNSIFVFVYNDYSTYNNDPHLEECFNAEEVKEILNSIYDLFEIVKCFGSELQFINNCSQLKAQNKQVYVYSMAQNVDGYGRRTLIPSICQYYGFINLNADAYMSAIGCNKKVMYDLLSKYGYDYILPPTFFVNDSVNYRQEELYDIFNDKIVIKPTSESCCIDVDILSTDNTSLINNSINYLVNKYKQVMLQKYISGSEIGITTFWHIDKAYSLQPIKIVFANGKNYLTHLDSFYTNYKLTETNIPLSILNTCEKMSKDLGFKCITRYDFRYDGSKYYLFDISPNPTINGYTSSNIAAQKTLKCDQSGIFRLMVYEKFNLFEPTFSRTK